MSVAYPLFANLAVGDSATVARAFSPADVARWRTLAGTATDTDEVPEPLIAGLFSYLLGEELPGHGTNYLKQELNFEGRARLDEPLTASVRISRLRPDKGLVNLETLCLGSGGRVICRGQALVLFAR